MWRHNVSYLGEKLKTMCWKFFRVFSGSFISPMVQIVGRWMDVAYGEHL